MKSTLQTALLILVLMGGVFGLTFMTQFSRTPVEPTIRSSSEKAAAEVLSGPPLRVPQQKAVWDSADETYAREFEVGTKGYYDFWVSNPHPKPVYLTVEAKSCVCTEVQIGRLPGDALKELVKKEELLSTAFNLVGAPNLAGVLASNHLASGLDWKTMTVASTAEAPTMVEVPPVDPATGASLAVVRMKFDGKEVKPLRLSADVRAMLAEQPAEVTRFEVPTTIVPPVIFAPSSINAGNLNPGDVKEFKVYGWSPARSQFQFKATELTNDPCIEIREARQLTQEEIDQMPNVFRQNGWAGNTRMKCGYEFIIAVHERRNGHQLELGPLTRKINVHATDQPDVTLNISGLVKGSIRVGEGNDQDRINLASFRAERGVEKTVLVSSNEANLDLVLKGKTPDFLNVTFEPMPPTPGLKQWKLKVEIEPNKHAGFLPTESAVYLQTTTTPPRSIRIPVIGNSTR